MLNINTLLLPNLEEQFAVQNSEINNKLSYIQLDCVAHCSLCHFIHIFQATDLSADAVKDGDREIQSQLIEG